jgi:hypothetical protein
MSLGKYVNPKNGSVAYPSDQEDVDILLESGHVKEEEGEGRIGTQETQVEG